MSDDRLSLQYRVPADAPWALREIVEFTNRILARRTATYRLYGFARVAKLDESDMAAIVPVDVELHSGFGESDTYYYTSTRNKHVVWLRQEVVERASMLDPPPMDDDDEIKAPPTPLPSTDTACHQRQRQRHEGRLLKFFLSCCLVHEMAHVVVRHRLPDDQQERVDTSPSTFYVPIASYARRPESGWYLEFMLWGGVMNLLMARDDVPWSVREATAPQVLGVVLEMPQGLHLLDGDKLVARWSQRQYPALWDCVAERNYTVKPQEVVQRMAAHDDTTSEREPRPEGQAPNVIIVRGWCGTHRLAHKRRLEEAPSRSEGGGEAESRLAHRL